MTDAVDCDVLVVGLGPVGAVLAALLAQQGVRVIAIDRDKEVYPLPRAAHFDHEIMRIFQQLGIAAEVAAHARVAPAYEFRNAAGEVLLRFDQAGQDGPSGWPPSFMFNQPGMEQAVRARLATFPNAQIRLERCFESFAEVEGGLLAALSGPAGWETVHARFIVGCDGARSAVREACGIALFDYAFDEPWLVIDAVPLPGARVPDVCLQICDPARPTTCVLMGPGRHRWEFMLKPGETPAQVLDDAFIRDLLAAWDCADTVEVVRKVVYRFHGLVAESWRSGRVLIAGDAAHQMPPFAGQGMCSGLRDAANLSWKLAAVLAGADDAILDTYQTEREPHVRGLIELAIAMGRLVCMSDPAAAAVRDAGLLAQRAAGTSAVPPLAPASFAAGFLLAGSPAAGSPMPQPRRGERRLDDVLGDGAWLIARGAPPRSRRLDGVPLTAISLGDEGLADFADVLSNWLDRQASEAVLVRPDRCVFGCGDPDALLAAFAAQLRGT